MAKTVNDGLARLQSESRISARTWRQWCSLLKLDPTDAVDVWEEICYPVMLATRRVPDVPFILQLRAARPELDVFDLKEEVPKVLHFASFLSGLRDQRLTAGKVKGALLAYYRLLAAGPAGRRPSPAFLRLLLVDLCSALLVSKILPAATITFSGVLKPVVEGKGSLEQVVRLGLRAVAAAPYSAVVRDSLGPSADAARQEALAFTAGSSRRSAAKDDEGDDEADEKRETESQDDDEEDDDAYERGGGPPAGEDDAEADRDEAEEEDETPAEAEDEADEEDEEAEGEAGGEAEDDDRDDDDDEAGEEDGDEEDEGDDRRDDEQDEEDNEPAASRIEVFLLRFKTALHAVYEAEAKAAGTEEEEQAETLLEDRLKAITLFRPLEASIPSLEEAQAMVRRAETKTRVVRTHRAVLGARPSAPIGATGGGGSGSAPARPPAATDRPAGAPKGEPARRPSPSVSVPGVLSSPEPRTSALGAGGQVEVAIADMVEPERLTLSEVNERVHQIGRLLAAIEPLDQTVWSLFLDPAATVKDLRGLARLLVAANSPTAKAGQGIRQIASLHSLLDLVRLPDQVVRKDRGFMVEVSAFVNGVNNQRVFEADSRQLLPLKRILDHAVGTLFRLEAVRTNQQFWRDHPDRYTRDAVTAYYEEALRLLTDQWNPELRRQVRQRADGDTDLLLQLFAAERFVEQVLDAARTYACELRDDGQTKSLGETQAALEARPVGLPTAEPGPVAPGEVPVDLLVSCGLGEVFDEVYRHLTTRIWAMLQPVHQPPTVIRRLREVLREVLVSALVLTPEMRRHQEKPNIALAVASLEKVSGNPALASYYVRLRQDGQIAYLETFEDGTYVDLFELRDYKPARMHHAAKKEAVEEGIEELQGGRKYLFTVGRTNRLFGENPSDLINGCIRAAEGGPKVFAVF